MIYFILIVYIAITFWGSLIGIGKQAQTPESYFLANRNLRTIGLFFTILATNFSAFYFLGFAAEGYKIGYTHYIIMATGTALAAIPMLLIGSKAWKLGKEEGYITPAELIYGQTQSRPLAALFSAVMAIFTLPYLSLQIVGGGYILENLTGGEISYALAIILLTVLTIVYVILGGMQSVAKTDLKQGLIVIVFMSLAVISIGGELGGLSEANARAAAIIPDLFEVSGAHEHYSLKKWFSFLVFWIFCIPMFPQLFMRFYIARSLEDLKNSAILYAFIPIIISILPVMIGVWGHISFPDLVGKEADQILPMMLKEHTSEWFSALVMTGAVAAFMSTLDSQLLAISTMMTRDFYIPFAKKELDFKSEVLTGRLLVGVFALIGLLIAFKPFDTIFDMGKMAFSGLAVLFPTALFCSRFKIKNPLFPILGITISLGGLLGFYYKWIPDFWAGGFEPFMLLIGISFLISAAGASFNKTEA